MTPPRHLGSLLQASRSPDARVWRTSMTTRGLRVLRCRPPASRGSERPGFARDAARAAAMISSIRVTSGGTMATKQRTCRFWFAACTCCEVRRCSPAAANAARAGGASRTGVPAICCRRRCGPGPVVPAPQVQAGPVAASDGGTLTDSAFWWAFQADSLLPPPRRVAAGSDDDEHGRRRAARGDARDRAGARMAEPVGAGSRDAPPRRRSRSGCTRA
jgi:hypothetical protein